MYRRTLQCSQHIRVCLADSNCRNRETYFSRAVTHYKNLKKMYGGNGDQTYKANNNFFKGRTSFPLAYRQTLDRPSARTVPMTTSSSRGQQEGCPTKRGCAPRRTAGRRPAESGTLPSHSGHHLTQTWRIWQNEAKTCRVSKQHVNIEKGRKHTLIVCCF